MNAEGAVIVIINRMLTDGIFHAAFHLILSSKLSLLKSACIVLRT